jgi:phosphorylase kinase alpha/beta subunit
MAKCREKEAFFCIGGLTVQIYYRMTTEATQYADTEVEELLTMLRETEHLEEQGDILQYLVDTQGLDFNTGG